MIDFFIKRRISIDDLDKLMFEVTDLSYIEDPKFYVTSVKDLVRFFIFSQNELAKVISERSNTNMYEFYSEIEENILEPNSFLELKISNNNKS
jgi:hypothetical protein